MITIKSQVEGGFPFKLTTTPNVSPDMKDKLQRAVNIASDRLREEKLREFINNYSYIVQIRTGRWFWKRVVNTHVIKGFYIDTYGDVFNTTKDKILEIVQNGRELVLGEPEDGEADVFWKLNNRSKPGVVGYTYKNSVWQYTYKNWAYGMSDEELAGHIVHEWLHKLGGEHTYKNHSKRKHTPTYAIGYYVGGKA